MIQSLIKEYDHLAGLTISNIVEVKEMTTNPSEAIIKLINGIPYAFTLLAKGWTADRYILVYLDLSQESNLAEKFLPKAELEISQQPRSFSEFIKEEEKKYTGSKPDGTDLIRISESNRYFKKYMSEKASLPQFSVSLVFEKDGDYSLVTGNVYAENKGEAIRQVTSQVPDRYGNIALISCLPHVSDRKYGFGERIK